MKDVLISVDLAKSVFQLHGTSMTGDVKFRKKLSRGQFLHFMSEHAPSLVVMEACGSAHYWARELIKIGHDVKLIAPQYVRPFVKRQKNDAADAEAIAVEAFAPPMDCFRRGRDFAAWLGLVPRQFSSGGKQRLGRVSKAGQADIRRLLIIGAMARVNWASRKPPVKGSWLARMLEKKPRMLVAIALANKMARAIWAMLVREEDYNEPNLAMIP